jgi:glycosyltransferase involved in cell wall biosynthesis
MIFEKNNNPIRVFLLTDTFYPPIIGGQQLYTSGIAQRLCEKGLEVSVITRKIDPISKSFEKIGEVSVHRISPTGLLKGNGWKAFIPVIMYLTKMFFILIKKVNQYDVLIVVSLKVLSIPSVIVKTIFGKKCIVVVISPSELREDILSDESLKKMNMDRSSIFVRLIRWIRNPIIKKSDCFVGLSAEIKQQYIDMGIDPKKIRIVPNGIDMKKFSPVSIEKKMMLRKELDIPKDRIVFCYTGRIVKTKGVLLLVQVWKEILKKYNNIYLLFVGSGKNSYDDCENELNEYINDNNLNEHVYTTGRVPEINVYLQASDVFVFPSEYEGFGLCILEGLASGLPAVLTRVGVATEVIENYNNGVAVSPKNQNELYAAIDWMLEHKNLWEAIGKNARKSVAKYSIEAETEQYIRMIKNLIKMPS